MRVTQATFQKLTLTAAAFAGLAFGPSNMFATALPIGSLVFPDQGILQVGNLGSALVGVTSIPICINWSGSSTCSGASHQMDVSGSSALFATGSNALDQIKDLNAYPPPILVNFEQVVGGAAVGGALVHFDLTQVVQPNGGAGFGNCGSNAANNSCAPPNSPFTFTEDSTGTQVTISFTTLLEAYTGADTSSGFTPYRAVFTTQQSGTVVGTGACSGVTASITAILTCEGNGGTVTATWSATESPISQIPEPISFVLLGSGLIGLSLGGRRLRRS